MAVDSYVLKDIAAQIDTGEEDPETSRALIVFNTGRSSRVGAALFAGHFSWAADAPFPVLIVARRTGEPVVSSVVDVLLEPHPSGSPDKVRYRLQLAFDAGTVPARSWTTFIVRIGGPSDASGDAAPPRIQPAFTVVETTRHGGALPSDGCLDELNEH